MTNMTSPAKDPLALRSETSSFTPGSRAQNQSAGKPDYKVIALQAAVSILRGAGPRPRKQEVVDMAKAFHDFLTG